MNHRHVYRASQWMGWWTLVRDTIVFGTSEQFNGSHYWHETDGWMDFPVYATFYQTREAAWAQHPCAEAHDALEALR